MSMVHLLSLQESEAGDGNGDPDSSSLWLRGGSTAILHLILRRTMFSNKSIICRIRSPSCNCTGLTLMMLCRVIKGGDWFGVRICSLYQTHITLNCPVPDRDNLNTTNRSSFTILNKFTVSNIHKHINRDCFLPCRGILEEKIYIWHLLNLVTISSGKIVWNHIIITFDKMCQTSYCVLACHNGTIWC